MRLILISLAVLSCVFIAGCETSQPIVNCDKITNALEADECYMNQSLRRYDASGCESIVNIDRRTECIDNIAAEILDYNVCKSHDRKSNEDKCEAMIGTLKKEKGVR